MQAANTSRQAAGFTKKGQANLNNSNRNQQAYTFEERKKEIPTNLTRHTEVDGVKVRIYSGHSYNRAHATGDVRDTGLSMNTIDNAIVRDVTNNVNISKLPVFPNKTGQKAQEVTIDVQGHSITYRAAKLPSGEVTINTYYLTPK